MGRYSGIGFVFSADDPYAGMDIDDCRNPETGEIAPEAKAVIDRLNSYTEVSPSGTGVKIWVKARLRGAGSRRDNYEMYDRGRYFTITGQHLEGTPRTVEERDAEYNAIHAELISPVPAKMPQPYQPQAAFTMSDGELLDKASRAANGTLFTQLWRGDTGNYSSPSEADLALCSILAFWTGNDAARVDRLFRCSGLIRSKWDEAHYSGGRTYGENTVTKACQGAECYNPELIRQATTQTHSGFVAALDWQLPVPFGMRDLPCFPVSALPAPLAEYVREVAAVKQVPEDLPGMSALAITAAAGAGCCEVHIGDGHIEPLNVYQATFMEPGSRKSATLEAMSFPLREAEREKIKELEPQITASKERRAVHEKRMETKRNQAAKEQGEDEYRVLIDEIEQMTENTPPLVASPCFLTEDVTPERMAGMLTEQKGVMAILTAEGGLFGMLAGRYSPNANIDIFLKGHAAEDYRVDRVGRPSEFIPKATITLGLVVQPDVLRSIAQNQEFRGRGLLARFLFSLPDSLVGTRFSQKGRSIDPQAKNCYSRVIRSILDLPEATTEDDPGARHPLLITGEAWDVWAAEADDVERRQAEGEDLVGIRDWASKLAGAVARIAGSFHLVQEAVNKTPWDKPISVETVAAAWKVGHYLIPHALAVFGQLGADPDQAQARMLLAWVERRGWLKHRDKAEQLLDGDLFTAYECFRSHQGVGKQNALSPGLNILCERNYIRLEDGAKNPNGGRPKSQTYRVNPAIYG